jgi:dolichol-phosphate mannosyltransferase
VSTFPRAIVAIATYNEIENLPRLVDEIFDRVPHAEVLVVDDNSPDGTGRWCDQRSSRDRRMHIVHRPGKLGLGTATLAAMRYAMEHDFEFLVTLDADFSHPPRYIPAMLQGMQGVHAADVIIGSRYVPGGGIEGWPWWRRITSRVLNGTARNVLALPVRDCSGAFRCFRVSLFRQIDLDSLHATGFSFLEEILWHLARAGARFAETPITFVDRREGCSKINFGEAWAALRTILRLGLRSWFRRTVRTTRPSDLA